MTKRMDSETAEQCAEQIVTEAIAYNKIGIQLKNIWIGKILDHWIIQEATQETLPEEDRNYYNLFQHSKVMKEVKNLNMTNGIGSLLDFLSNVDNSRVEQITEKKIEDELQIDFAGLWDKSNERDRLTFFKRHDESKCPTGTKYVARKYYIDKGLNPKDLMRW